MIETSHRSSRARVCIDAIKAGDKLDVGGARVVVDKIDGDEVHIHDAEGGWFVVSLDDLQEMAR